MQRKSVKFSMMMMKVILVAVLMGVLSLSGNPVSTRAENPDITGSWFLTISPMGEETMFGVTTYTSDGTMISDYQAIGVTAQHGAWQQAEDGTFVGTWKAIAYEEDGSLTAIMTTHVTMTLDETGDTFEGEFVLSLADAEGNYIPGTSGTVTGERIKVEATE